MSVPRSLAVPCIERTVLTVPGLGRISGLSYNDGQCHQYLGIPYGEIPGRFRRSVPAREPWPGETWNGTKLGPYCPQPPRDFYPIPLPPPRSWLNTPKTDEFDCLNLNISVPLHDPTIGPLPVMVFFHGGAFTYSAGSSPIYDGRLMATASAVDHGTPTIIITLNYRLGVYGFLGGTDLQTYAASVGEEGCGNYGVWDQVIALRWVQKHIAAFGGDPSRVCIFGQSAGSVSVACHMNREEPLFESAMMQSGALSLCGIMTPGQYQAVFEKIIRQVGISLDLDPEERVKALAKVPEDALTKAMIPVFEIPVITMALCDDGVLLPKINQQSTYENFEIPPFVKRLAIGDVLHECIIWNKSWRHLSAPDLLQTMQEFLGNKTGLVADLYQITPDMTAKQTAGAIERLTTDGLYRIANHLAVRAVPRSFAYHFNVPSQYDNEWATLCHHSYDNVLIWGVLKHTLSPAQQKISEEMTAAWIRFANGINPWEPFAAKEQFCIFGPEEVQMQTKEEYDKSSYRAWDILERNDLVKPLMELSAELCLQRRRLLSPIR